MTKSILLTFLLVGGTLNSFAQDAVPADEPAMPLFQHQVGVQMNELIRQVFNFNSATTTAPSNPFLLTYTLTHAKTGIGLRLGGGYDQRRFVDDDGITQRDGKIKNVNFRAGLEKSFRLSKKWSAGAGGDFVYAKDENETKSSISASNPTIVISKSTVGSIGAGGMAWLRYHINKNVLVGTETSFYYRQGNLKNEISITQTNSFPFPVPTTNVSTTDVDQSEGIFSVPAVFYLIVKF